MMEELFYKSAHYLNRQIKRGISNKLTNELLNYAKPSNNIVKLVAYPDFLKRFFEIKSNKCLVLVIDKSKLVTCFWADIRFVMFNKEFSKGADIQSLT